MRLGAIKKLVASSSIVVFFFSLFDFYLSGKEMGEIH